jgi:hypothetical protein
MESQPIDDQALIDKMGIALNNYLSVGLILREDWFQLAMSEEDSPLWRRNFTRSAIALLEGCCNCYLDICAVVIKCKGFEISKAEKALINSRREILGTSIG